MPARRVKTFKKELGHRMHRDHRTHRKPISKRQAELRRHIENENKKSCTKKKTGTPKT